jgi:phosphatidylinositol glycan class N
LGLKKNFQNTKGHNKRFTSSHAPQSTPGARLTSSPEQKNATHIDYKPYAPLADLSSQFVEIETLLARGHHTAVIEKSMALIKTGLEGLRYLQTYDWLLLRTIVTLGYLGWIAFALTTVIDLHVLHGAADAKPQRTLLSTFFFSGVLVGLWTLFFIQKSRPTYYAYAFFPVVFWEEVFVCRHAVARGVKQLVREVPGGKSKYFWLLVQALLGVGLLEAIVLGYFHREVFSVCFVLAAFWPFLYGLKFVGQNMFLCALWPVCCFAMSAFTLLPVVKTESEMQM